MMWRVFLLALLPVALVLPSLGCVTVAAHPCTKGGQPAHDDGKIGKGTKQCLQVRDTSGSYVNQGKYTEWHPNGQRALEGEYAAGLKTGKWTEWDDQGRKLSEKWYEGGQLIPGREEQPYNGLGPPPRPVVKPTPAAAAPVPSSSSR
jgi:hypothetical protein